MDHKQMGYFIKERRKEKGMTQKELAERLHVTDRAVSKWERGLSIPDISLWERLSEVLGVSVLELLGEGSQEEMSDSGEKLGITRMLHHSVAGWQNKEKRLKKKYNVLVALLCFVILGLVLLLIWWGGNFSVLERVKSPDGNYRMTVYDEDVLLQRFTKEPTVSVKIRGLEEYNMVYYNAAFRGVWWAPDSKKYVIALEQDGKIQMFLEDMEGHNSTNLHILLGLVSSQIEEIAQMEQEDLSYEFLMWSSDSKSMLIYYQNINAASQGYFWYDCEDGNIKGLVEE